MSNQTEQEKIERIEIDALTRILDGGDANEMGANWYLYNDGFQFALAAGYQNMAAFYGFNISKDGNNYLLVNHHRNAVKGKGTESLVSLEKMLSVIAKQKNGSIRIEFPLYGQEDTKIWLEKNNYTIDSQTGNYYKIIS